VEVCFTFVFTIEICYRVKTEGLRKHFLGDDRLWSTFDAMLILVAIMDAIVSILPKQSLGRVHGLTVLRVVRLARLTRIVRLLRLRMFKELLLMVKGLFVGLRTLVWAIFLLMGLIYCIGVFLRQTVGAQPKVQCTSEEVPGCSMSHVYMQRHREELFSTVLRSMFTVFRCFIDGCSAPDGTPLMTYIFDAYGWWTLIIYAMCMFFCNFWPFQPHNGHLCRKHP